MRRRREPLASRHRQPTIRGTQRIPRTSALLPELDSAIQSEADEFNVSKSWITAIALARHLRVDVPRALDYRAMPWKRKRTDEQT